MADFLDAFSLEKSTEKDHHESELTVATIHASKGLEYDCVVLCGAGSGQMPHPKSIDPESFEEERRLMYVAVTRARSRLLITYPDRRRARLAPAPEPVPAAEVSLGRAGPVESGALTAIWLRSR